MSYSFFTALDRNPSIVATTTALPMVSPTSQQRSPGRLCGCAEARALFLLSGIARQKKRLAKRSVFNTRVLMAVFTLDVH